QADYLTIIQPMLWQGVGGSLFFIALSAISLSEIRPNQLALAAGLSNFVRISAGAFGTSIASTVWDSRTRHHRVHLVEDASRAGWSFDSPFYEPLHSAGMTLEQLRAYLERLIDQQAMTLGANEVFLVSALLYLLLILPVMLARPAQGRRAGPAPAPSAAPRPAGNPASLKA
ncbi:MAG: MFS transporter, partial [Betaproteobacteria bacterium]|nr:MFS transporter [Betaproteobacteria bacterium]